MGTFEMDFVPVLSGWPRRLRAALRSVLWVSLGLLRAQRVGGAPHWAQRPFCLTARRGEVWLVCRLMSSWCSVSHSGPVGLGIDFAVGILLVVLLALVIVLMLFGLKNVVFIHRCS